MSLTRMFLGFATSLGLLFGPIANAGKPIVIDQVQEVTISTADQSYDPSKPKAMTCTLSGMKAQTALKKLGIGQPEQPGGVPAAMVTANIKIRLNNGERTFIVYNELLLNDEQESTVYFRLKSPITSKICSR